MNELSTKEVIDDLLSERSLWTIYVTSRRIPFSKFNNGVGIAIGLICSVQATAVDTGVAMNQVSVLATLVFNTTVSLLGFLLAGFTFFATVADKSLFCRMAAVKHDSGLSFLKYNLFLFLRVFVEFLTLCVFALLVILFMSEGSGLRVLLSEAVGKRLLDNHVVKAAAIILTGLLSGTFVYSLMQLKSFIFNIYHVVMTSIAWEVERTAEQASRTAEAELDKE